jgi:hypothetical protein
MRAIGNPNLLAFNELYTLITIEEIAADSLGSAAGLMMKVVHLLESVDFSLGVIHADFLDRNSFLNSCIQPQGR